MRLKGIIIHYLFGSIDVTDDAPISDKFLWRFLKILYLLTTVENNNKSALFVQTFKHKYVF